MSDKGFLLAEQEDFHRCEKEYGEWKKRSNLYYYAFLMLPVWLMGTVGIVGGCAIITVVLHFAGII